MHKYLAQHTMQLLRLLLGGFCLVMPAFRHARVVLQLGMGQGIILSALLHGSGTVCLHKHLLMPAHACTACFCRVPQIRGTGRVLGNCQAKPAPAAAGVS